MKKETKMKLGKGILFLMWGLVCYFIVKQAYLTYRKNKGITTEPSIKYCIFISYLLLYHPLVMYYLVIYYFYYFGWY